MKNIYTIFLFCTCCFFGCTDDDNSTPSLFKYSLRNTTPVPLDELKSLEGVYTFSTNEPILGRDMICKVNKDIVTIVTNQNGLFMVFNSGYSEEDTAILLAGYWKSPLTGDRGNIRLSISGQNNLAQLKKKKLSTDFFMQGFYGITALDSLRFRDMKMVFTREFPNKLIKDDFWVMAHRGGGRNSDNHPYSENSIEMIKHATDFGASGIEIDIKLTKDKIPVLYHDDDINIRLTQKSPLMGDLGQYTYNVLQDFVRLINGERIPSLENTLNFVIDSTTLNVVWLDIKGDREVFKVLEPIITAANTRALNAGRTLTILMGIPSDDVVKEFELYDNKTNLPSLCEISLEQSKIFQSKVWAPRWTLGLLNTEVEDAHKSKIKVVTWTLDEPSIIKNYAESGNFDGILTNYPSIVAYANYIKTK